jgi:hypothetical protein
MSTTPLRTDGAIRSRTPNRAPRLSRFVFTLNNYTEQEYTDIISTDVRWIVVGREIGDEGTPHLQGACVIGKQTAFSTIKKWSGFGRAHIEPMRGKPIDSLNYCTKQDKDAFVKGEMPQEGKRNDLHDTINLLLSGSSIQSMVNTGNVAALGCFTRYPKGLQLVSSMLKPRRSEPPLVIWLSGETGIGKTRSAVRLAELIARDNYWISSGSLRWFDGYDGQAVTIFDDLRTKHAEFSFLLRLLDRYPLRVEFKGGFVGWSPYVVIITAPKSPTDMWSLRNDEDKQQLSRRVHLQYDASHPDDHEKIFKMLREAVDGRWPGNKYPWDPQVNDQSSNILATERRHSSSCANIKQENNQPIMVSDSSSEKSVDRTLPFIDLTSSCDSQD